MTLARRQFLAAIPASCVCGLGCGKRAAVDPYRLATERDWKAVRGRFPMLDDLAYFNAGGLGPAPAPVLDAVCDTMRSLHEHTSHGHKYIEQARPHLAEFLGAQPEEIAFTRNATEGNSTVASGLSLESGDEVILDAHAHQGGSVCWMVRQNYEGIVVKSFEPDRHDPQINLDRIARLVSQRTRVIQVSHVTAPTGIKMPVEEIAGLARDCQAWFHIDGAQSLGLFPFNLHQIGCDSYAASGHKWLCGPTGTGVLYVRRQRLDEVQPTDVGAYGDDDWQVPSDLELVDTARRFECGTRDAATIVGLQRAVDFINELGFQRVHQRGMALADYLRPQLQEIDGVQLLSPEDPRLRTAMTTFQCRGLACGDVYGRLFKAGLRCRPVREQGLDGIRVSTHFFNFEAEIDQLVATVKEIVTNGERGA